MKSLASELRSKRVYVASSWRNDYQPGVVQVLRADGHAVYDFKDSEGFHWSEVDEYWKEWTPTAYLEGLQHPCAVRGFNRDMQALRECDVCVYVMPCGPSASMEMGWAVGAGKRVIVYIPALREPDLMIKMAHAATADIEEVRKFVAATEGETPAGTLTEEQWVVVRRKLQCVCLHLNISESPLEPNLYTAVAAVEEAAEWARKHIEERGRQNDELRSLLYECIRELSYVEEAECWEQVKSSLGANLVDRGMKILGVDDLSKEKLFPGEGERRGCAERPHRKWRTIRHKSEVAAPEKGETK